MIQQHESVLILSIFSEKNQEEDDNNNVKNEGRKKRYSLTLPLVDVVICCWMNWQFGIVIKSFSPSCHWCFSEIKYDSAFDIL